MILYTLNRIRKYYFILIELFCSFIQKVDLNIKSIKYGKNCKFIGYTTFYKTAHSQITISEKCTFNSTTEWNLLGCNKRCIISTLTPNACIQIGSDCGFSGVTIGAFNCIKIGNQCIIGANVTITDSDWHPIHPNNRHNGDIKTSPVIIGDNVFIGANSIILKGSIIGKNSVIGAGSVVSGNIPENTIAEGNPCKIIRKIE